MKKKVLFMLINMNVGGTERAFLNMLNRLPEEDYDITVLLLQKKGGFLQQLPEHVTIKIMKEFPELGRQIVYHPKEKIKMHLSERQYKQAFFLFALHAYMKITRDRRTLFKKAFKKIPALDEEYDIAVAYAGPMDIITYYIATKVKAVEKYQWIHFDVNNIGFDSGFASRMYQLFNRIYVVSDTAATHLKAKLPKLSGKIETQINDIPVHLIHQLAEEDVFSSSTSIRIVTVARIAKEKGPDLAVKIMKMLKELGHNVEWYWVGEGEWMSTIQEMIREYGLESTFILEGAKSNPYPYIRQSDVYVQPSRHEGYCITIAEARALNKPMVTTATAGARAQIKHGETGLIAEVNEQDILKKIIKLIEDPDLRLKLTKRLHKENNNVGISIPFEKRTANYDTKQVIG